ncbi:MAG: hypothetical protein ABIO83_01275 [Ilumatobacteraceae bacterium]
MGFDTPITTDGEVITGPERFPRQMLGDQEYDGHASVHDGEVADRLGLPGAPIEGPTHFSQFDPLAVEVWGDRWFETGCISAHFQTMVVEGESVVASMTRPLGGVARIDAVKADGTPVLTGTATVDPDAPTELRGRLATMREREPGELFIVDRVEVGRTVAGSGTVTVDRDSSNGLLYPFSLRRKLDGITEPSRWYDTDDTPWGRAILPFEMFSVLTSKLDAGLRVRGPAVGLFIDLEVRAVAGPLFVDEPYRLEREVLAVGQSRRVESHWQETRVLSAATDALVASVLLHSGVFKASYAAYPADRL